jgi:hypothetical protein
MVYFVCKSLKWIFGLILIQFCTVVFSVLMVDKFDIRSFIKIKNEVNKAGMIFIMGNSHPACAINDSILPNNYANISLNGEPLFYTTIKARRLLEDNCKIDSMIINFTNNSLTTICWVLDDNRMMGNYKQYFSLMNFKEHMFLFNKKPVKAFKTILSLTPTDIYLSKRIINGGSLFETGQRILPFRKTFNSSKERRIYNYQIEDEMLGFAQLLSLMNKYPSTYFIITRMPMRSSIVLENENQYKNCLEQLKKNQNCRLIDFLQTNLKDEEFWDYEHLNYIGAKRFTSVFKDSLWSR